MGVRVQGALMMEKYFVKNLFSILLPLGLSCHQEPFEEYYTPEVKMKFKPCDNPTPLPKIALS